MLKQRLLERLWKVAFSGLNQSLLCERLKGNLSGRNYSYCASFASFLKCLAFLKPEN